MTVTESVRSKAGTCMAKSQRQIAYDATTQNSPCYQLYYEHGAVVPVPCIVRGTCHGSMLMFNGQQSIQLNLTYVLMRYFKFYRRDKGNVYKVYQQVAVQSIQLLHKHTRLLRCVRESERHSREGAR